MALLDRNHTEVDTINQYADKIANIGSILYRSQCLVFGNDIRFIALGYECRKVT